MSQSDPKLAARELGAQLRDLRLRTGFSGQRLAEAIGCSQSKISKLETGRLRPHPDDVRAITEALGAPDETRRQLIERAEEVKRRDREFRAHLRDRLAAIQRAIVAQEQNVATMRDFQLGVVPGLLQTPEYAAHQLRRYTPSEEDAQRAVAARLERQLILQDPARQLHFVIAESALQARLAPPIVMRVQLERLLSVSALPTVSIEIIPATAQLPRAPLHGFVILDDALVAHESFDQLYYVDDPRRVQVYLQVFEAFRAVAASPEEGRALIESIIAELSSELQERPEA